MGRANINISVTSPTADSEKIVMKPASQDIFYNPGICSFPEDPLKNQQNIPGVEGFFQLLDEDNLEKDKMLIKVIIMQPAGRREQ